MSKAKKKRKRQGKQTVQRTFKIVQEATAKLTRHKREKVPRELGEKIRELAHAGHSKSQIARALHVSRSTVQDHTRDIKAAPRVHRARADLVREVMDRFKGFYSVMVRVGITPRDLGILARWLREKAGREDDVTLETLVDDHFAYLSWFVEALERDSDFLKAYPQVRGLHLASGDRLTQLSKRLEDGRILTVTVNQPEPPKPLALPVARENALDEEEEE